VSNVLGTVNPVKAIIAQAHAHGIPVLIDAAQSAPHLPLDVQDLDCDFLAFSGHKMYGPTGIGVLYGKEEWLDRLPPYQGGGEMIDRVSWEKTTFERLPFKFEAGTPDYVATHGLATAIDYMCALGLDNIMAHEQELTRYCLEQMQTIPNIRIFGPVDSSQFTVQSSQLPTAQPNGQWSMVNGQRSMVNGQRSMVNGQWSMVNGQCPRDAVISFLVGDIHHLDMGTLLDRLGIAVRTGHHCAHPLMDRLGVTGTVRASFALYNTKEEVDILIAGIRRVAQMF
jgi:cysteine desulfurase/selenocysteine lyase